MFGRIFQARATLAARPGVDWEKAVDYGERVLEGERFLFSCCRFCGERLAGFLCAAMTAPAPPANCVSASSTTCTPAVRASLRAPLLGGQ
jgi:hypothetical protein